MPCSNCGGTLEWTLGIDTKETRIRHPTYGGIDIVYRTITTIDYEKCRSCGSIGSFGEPRTKRSIEEVYWALEK